MLNLISNITKNICLYFVILSDMFLLMSYVQYGKTLLLPMSFTRTPVLTGAGKQSEVSQMQADL